MANSNVKYLEQTAKMSYFLFQETEIMIKSESLDIWQAEVRRIQGTAQPGI